VLNVGLTEASLRAMIRMTGNPRLAFDCERRLVEQYGEVVHAIPAQRFAGALKPLLVQLGAAGTDEPDILVWVDKNRLMSSLLEAVKAPTASPSPSASAGPSSSAKPTPKPTKKPKKTPKP
jgi:hypothetical protein